MTRKKGLPPDYNAVVFIKKGEPQSARIGVAFDHAAPRQGMNVLLSANPASDTFHLRAVVPAGVDGAVTASSTVDTGRGADEGRTAALAAYVVERAPDGDRWTRIGTATQHRDKLGWRVVVAMYPRDGNIILKDPE